MVTHFTDYSTWPIPYSLCVLLSLRLNTIRWLSSYYSQLRDHSQFQEAMRATLIDLGQLNSRLYCRILQLVVIYSSSMQIQVSLKQCGCKLINCHSLYLKRFNQVMKTRKYRTLHYVLLTCPTCKYRLTYMWGSVCQLFNGTSAPLVPMCFQYWNDPNISSFFSFFSFAFSYMCSRRR